MSKPFVDHIGVLVADMDKAVEMFRKLFKMAPDMTKDRPDVGVRIAMFETANVTIELLQYSDQAPSFSRAVMGDRMGINHVCFQVDDVEKSVEEITAQGVDMIEGFPIQGAHGRVAFFDPDQTESFFFEVYQPDPRPDHE